MAGKTLCGELSGSLENIIREQLYPEDKFPLRVFPDLIPLLTNLFFKEKKNTATENFDSRNEKLKEINKQAVKILNLNSLVKNHPDILVLLYRNLISNYISRKHFYKNEIEDIVQEIITRILDKKIERIKDTFDFTDTQNPTFTSYFMVTIRNIYIDIIRKGKIENERESLDENSGQDESAGNHKMINTLILEEEFLKLEALLKLYHRLSSKIILILKIKYKINITEKNIRSCFSGCSPEDIDLFKSNVKQHREKVVFKRIVPLFNKYEGKKNRADSLRKWISVKVDEIKNHMNNTHINSPYTRSNISDLFILYFKWYSERER